MRLAILGVAFQAIVCGSALAERFVVVGSWGGEIRRYKLDGTSMGTFIAAGTAGMSFPDGLAYGSDNNLYVADANNARILKFNGVTGAPMGTFAMGGMQRAGYCAFGPDGKLYVCSSGDNAVHRYDPTTGAHLGAFAMATGAAAGMVYPAGLAWVGNTMYVAGFQSNRVYTFDATTGTSTGTLSGSFNRPLYLRPGIGGNLFISEYGRNAVARYNLAQNRVATSITAGMNGPVGQVSLPNGELLVCEWNGGFINRYNEANGALLGRFSTETFANCNDILVSPDLVIPAPAAGCVLGFAGLLTVRRRR
ncbi:MAG TPA: hypothetical protein VF777_15065 [Phycisphaerales bacterium]